MPSRPIRLADDNGDLSGAGKRYISPLRILQYLSAILLLVISTPGSMAQRVFMTGDSHVFSKIYPAKVEATIKSEHPDVDFSWWAKNGICFYTFNTTPEYFEKIFEFKPDILIVHLGTNGAYANNFTRKEFRKEIEKFHATVADSLPGVNVVYVTPFTNIKRKKRKKGKGYVNYHNREASDEIVEFAEGMPGAFVIDNNEEAGMTFLKSKQLIRPDQIHLTALGYERLGTQVGERLLDIDELWTQYASVPDPRY